MTNYSEAFANIVKNLRLSTGLSEREMDKVVGLYQGAFKNYETKGIIPVTENLFKILKYFDVTADYLVGRKDKHKNSAEYYETIGEALKNIREKMNLSQEDVANKAEQKLSEYKLFEENKTHRIDCVKLGAICDVLHASVDELLRLDLQNRNYRNL